MSLNFKVGGDIDQSTSLITYGVGVAHVDVAAQAGAQQSVETAVHSDNVVTLPARRRSNPALETTGEPQTTNTLQATALAYPSNESTRARSSSS